MIKNGKSLLVRLCRTMSPFGWLYATQPLTCTHFGQRAVYLSHGTFFPSPAGKGQQGQLRCVAGAGDLQRASGRKQLTDKFVCLPENDGRILSA